MSDFPGLDKINLFLIQRKNSYLVTMTHQVIIIGAGRAVMSFSGYRFILNLFIVFGLFMASYSAQAHHVLGRPSYSLGSESNTPPSAQVETQIGSYYVTYMVFPAFPEPNQPGRVNLYASRIDNGVPFQGRVTFKIIDNGWFGSQQVLLGVQEVDDNVFRQAFEFSKAGQYIIRAEFEPEGELLTIDFPLQIGEASSFGPLGISIVIFLIVLLGVNVTQHGKLVTAKIKNAHQANSHYPPGDGGV